MKRLLFAALFLGFALLTPTFAQDSKNPHVVLDTTAGKITLELNAEKAPVTVKNFLQYVEDKHYDGTIFHRVIPDFMIQGGGFESGLRQRKTREPIKNESSNGLSNARGTIAMARTADLDGATAQFYINVVDNTGLDKAQYCVFGKVIDGMDVVDAIRRVKTTTQGFHKDVPAQDVVIKTARRVK